MDSKSNRTIATQSGDGSSTMATISSHSKPHASATHASTKGSNDPNGTSGGEVATAATHPGGEEELEEYDEDGVLEAELILQLQAVVEEMSLHYKNSHGRVLKSSLRKLKSLADERRTVLSEYDNPDDDFSATAFAQALAARAFLDAMDAQIANIAAYRNESHGHIKKSLIHDLDVLVEARVEALAAYNCAPWRSEEPPALELSRR
ncbi:hypothetical protein B0T18DRAFT_445485 [Schizothecium vesticola]|uniref:Uncharacterized protein n=1 Tax=Schizothecium vesticola TaxID=314040 RepID=A0AA40F247_9PEZI|nr:hypothetical protein B0T18DRAFT_445485 [Schizothecium vesticola]